MSRREQIFIAVNNLSYSNLQHILFQDANLSLTSGEKVGLIGHNGCGKSTLLQLLTKSIQPSTGQIIHASAMKIYLVEQSFPQHLLPLTPEEALLDVLSEDEQLTKGWRAGTILEKLNLGSNELALTCSRLSGGMQTRILLARALLFEPNVLLLDEPSNHLDLPTIIWLETFLQEWKTSFILVSHDTRLLDKVTNRTWIISSGLVHQYRIPCSHALSEHEKREKSSHEQFQVQAAEIERIESSARQLSLWGKEQHSKSSARKAQSMLKRVDKLKQEQTVLPDPYPWNLTFPGQSMPADKILSCDYFAVRPGLSEQPLYFLQNLTIKPGEKIALIGANGTGKSTLLELIWKCYQRSAFDLSLHESAVIAYYDQLQNGVNSESELLDALQDYCGASYVRITNDSLKNTLLSAGFLWERLKSKVNTLSGGEKSRLMFAGISMINSHLLLLDEPTNHLDITGKRELEKQLQLYKGTLLMVSHDRDLIESICSQFIAISNHKLHFFSDASKAFAMLENP